MKRSTLTAMLLASCFVVPALAEDATKMKQGAQVQTDTGTTASTNADGNFGRVISAIRAGKTNVDALKSLTTVSSVKVIKVSDLAKGSNTQALDNALADNQADITTLQTTISGNTALKAQLDAQSVTTTDIVAANIEADGSVTVYVK
jgi:prophage DNA circulation protein